MSTYSEKVTRSSLLLIILTIASEFILVYPSSVNGQIQAKSAGEIIHRPKNFNEVFPTPLLRSIVQGNTWIVDLMLSNGVSPNSQDGSEMRLTPILVAAYYGKNDILKSLIQHGARIEAKDEKGMTALMYACFARNLATVKQLADEGAKINSRAHGGTSPLSIAGTLGDRPILEFLLFRGADVNNSTDTGATVLMLATDDKEIVNTLIKFGANVDAQDQNGWSALFHATDRKQIKKMGILIKHGARTDISDRFGITVHKIVQKVSDPSLKESMLRILESGKD